MRLRLLSRASNLAVLQSELVARALRARWPDLDVVCARRSSEGDRDRRSALWAMSQTGVFTADLTRALATGEADAAVHSWKDLPIAAADDGPSTVVAGTLERADPRDVLLVRRDVLAARPATLEVLSSSPRRASQLDACLRRFLPWPVADLEIVPVRGNIPTRVGKLASGEGDALVVAKAALDRLLSDEAADEARSTLRAALGECRWIVLPLKECPTAPAQGAIAVEVLAERDDLRGRVLAISHEPTWKAAMREREILASYGGGCHDAVGATVLVRDYGDVTSVYAARATGEERTWALDGRAPLPPSATLSQIWPRPDERDLARRRALDTPPMPAGALWVARAEALPADWHPSIDQLVWAAGSRTWEKLARRGVWVNGCADGLGDAESPNVDVLAGEHVAWRRLTHTASGDPDAVATYAVDQSLPDDLPERTHFFWTSGSAFLDAVGRHPSLRSAWHASGPGRTARVLRDTLSSAARPSIWLDYEQWLHTVTS